MDDLEAAIAEVVRGDASAFRRIVEQTSPQLVRLGARILGSVEDAEDVVQEAYVRAYRSLVGRSFDGRSSVRTWLYRIVVNGAIDARRKRVRRIARAAAEPVGRPLTTPDAVEARLALAELASWLDGLPEEQRTVVVLTAIEGMSAGEVAEILGCSEGAVEQRLLRARGILRKKRDAP